MSSESATTESDWATNKDQSLSTDKKFKQQSTQKKNTKINTNESKRIFSLQVQ